MQVSSGGTDERGAVSIFIVIFFALLISVITMSFIGIVIRGTTQSTNNDLSRSAYDSATSGVEDGKRAIALYANDCIANGQAACDARYGRSFSSTDCNAFGGFLASLHPGITDPTNVPVQEGTVTNNFNQAYTCVNITMNTPDYLNSVPEYQSDVIPLKGVGPFDSMNLNWFTHTDANAPSDATTFTPRATGVNSLPPESEWDTASAQYTPSLMRVELISYSGTINDNGPGSPLANSSHTVFLYPSASGQRSVDLNASDVQPPSAANPAPIIPVACGGNDIYACNIRLTGIPAGSTAFLRVTPIYKKATFQVQLTNGGSAVNFSGVQPIVDSTGRAGDLFRRVAARVRLQNNILYPSYAVDSNTSLCKDYLIGSIDSDFKNNCN